MVVTRWNTPLPRGREGGRVPQAVGGLAVVRGQRRQVAEVLGVGLLGGLHERAEDYLRDSQALRGAGEGELEDVVLGVLEGAQAGLRDARVVADVLDGLPGHRQGP